MSLVYVRHGETPFNDPGNDPKKERLRGWLPLPLTAEGRQHAHQVAEKLKGHPFASFHTSDLPRAMETARIIGQHIGMQPTPAPAIRDWNTGSLAGQSVHDALPRILSLMRRPGAPAPDGEALNDYLMRFTPPMRWTVADKRMHLVVGHARGSSVLDGIASPNGGVGKSIDPAMLEGKPRLHPAGMMLIDPHWNVQVLGEHDDPAQKLSALAHPHVDTPMGTPAGYMEPEEGPFECEHCMFARDKSTGCVHPMMLLERGDRGDGLAPIKPHGCCNYFKKSRTQEDQ